MRLSLSDDWSDCACYALIGLGPLLAASLAITTGLWLEGLLQIGADPVGAAGSGMAGMLIALASIGAALLLYQIDVRVPSAVGRLGLLYLAWFVAGAGLLYVTLLILGATSMAMAEGLVTPNKLRRLAGEEALRLLLPAQLCILPWVVLATALLTRLRRRRSSTPSGASAAAPAQACDDLPG